MPSHHRDPASLDRVLVVDDMDLVRSTLGRQFEHLGCQVREAASAEEALELLRASPSGWDLVVTDQGMPGMRGDELLSTVRRLCPTVRTVLLTGWGPVDCPAADRVLHKPPPIAALKALLRSDDGEAGRVS